MNNSNSSGNVKSKKRKRVVLTIQEKLNAIKRLDKGELLKKVASDYNVGVSTVTGWRNNRKKIEQWASVIASPNDRKSMKNPEHTKVDKGLYLWFTQQRDSRILISGPILQQKAISLSEELPVIEAPANFTASEGWLSRWKKRYGIRQLNICGEKLSADSSAVTDFTKKFLDIIADKGYQPDQIYNCDETGLNYKMLPSKTLASKQETSAPGYKRSKERITVLACSNFSGRHKLPLMCIGKSANPRAFKNIHSNVLPVYYKSQKSAWMDSNLFKNWYLEQFVPKVEKFLKQHGHPRRALLLLDNAPSHPNPEDLKNGEIEVLFLPPNVTALLQPMDQGVLENLKRNYRRLLLEAILEQLNNGTKENLVSCLKNINLKDVVFWLADAWNQVKDVTLQKSWSKIIPQQHEYQTEDGATINESRNLFDLIQELPGCENVTANDVNQWIIGDEKDNELSDGDLIKMVGESKEEEYSSDEEGTVEISPKISHSSAMDAFETALLYVEQQPNATPTDVLLLKRWRDIAAKNRSTVKKKQVPITSFLN